MAPADAAAAAAKASALVPPIVLLEPARASMLSLPATPSTASPPPLDRGEYRVAIDPEILYFFGSDVGRADAALRPAVDSEAPARLDGIRVEGRMDIAFAGKRVLVTGAARGIGRAIVQGFAGRGAEVHAADILAEGLSALANAVPCAAGGSLALHAADLTDSATVARLVAGIGEGGPDVLVHAAGGVRGQTRKSIEEVSDADWAAIMDANMTAAFKLARAVAPAMKRRGTGRFVIISSGAGLGVSLTGIQAYATAKAAEIGFTRQLASELGAHGITVNSVAPGVMPTSPDYVRQWESYPPERQRQIIDGIAMKRLGKPEDIAHAVMFLASDYAGFITGQTLSVRGGP